MEVCRILWYALTKFSCLEWGGEMSYLVANMQKLKADNLVGLGVLWWYKMNIEKPTWEFHALAGVGTRELILYKNRIWIY